MQRLKNILRPEALLFIFLAGVFWLVMTVSRAESSRVISVKVHTAERVVEDQWLLDTTAVVQVRVAAQGMNVLRLRSLENNSIQITGDSWQLEGNSVRSSSSDLMPAISEILENTSIQPIDPWVSFPSSTVVTEQKAVAIRGLDQIRLPSGYQWIDPLKIEPLLIELRGYDSEIQSIEPYIEVTPTIWDGAMGISYEVQGLPHGIGCSNDEVVLLGHSAVWSDKRYKTEVRDGQRVYPIEIWLSGPAEYMKDKDLGALGALKTSTSDNGLYLDFQPNSSNLSVLQITPSFIQKH